MKAIKRFRKKYMSLPLQVRASMWFLICAIIQKSITIVTTPVFTRLLSTSDYGKYNGFMSWMGIITCFVTMYIYSGIYPQAIVKYKDEKALYSSSMQGLTASLVLLWTIIYLIFSRTLNSFFSLTTLQMLAMFIIMWGHAIFGFWSIEQRVDYKYGKLVIITLAEAMLQSLLCVLLITQLEDKVTGLVWGIALANIVCYFPLFVIQLHSGGKFLVWKIWKYALGLAIPLIPHFISSVLLSSSDRIMIQRIIGDSQAGIYSLAYTLSLVGSLINQAMLQTLEPWVFEKIKSQNTKNIKKIIYPILVMVASVNIVIVLFAPEIIRVFGPVEYYDAIWVMPPIIMSVFFMFMYHIFSFFEFYFNKVSFISIATGIGAVLNIILNLIFIRIFGYYAAGYTTLVCYILFCISHYFFMKKICKIECNNSQVFDSKILLFISVCFLAIGFLIMYTYNYMMLRYLLAASITLFLFLMRKTIIKYLTFVIHIKKGLNP